jgi:hypothetical protein
MHKQQLRTRERWDEQEAERQSDDRSHEMMTSDLENQWIDYLSHPNVQHSMNLRVELTLKQRRATELETRRPTELAAPRYWHCYKRVDTFVPETNSTFPVKVFPRVILDDEKTVNVRVGRPHRASLRDAPLYAPFYYLTDDEVRRIAVRMMHRLNKELFGNAARRKNNPERLTAVICQHDKKTRRHLHCLFAVPPTVPLTDFLTALENALRDEPFVYRVRNHEPVRDLAASVLYNIDERKSLTSNPILYLYPQLSQPTRSTPNERPTQ